MNTQSCPSPSALRMIAPTPRGTQMRRRTAAVTLVLGAMMCFGLTLGPASAVARVTGSSASSQQAPAPSPGQGSSLEAAAARAGDTGRKVAMSLIGLALAIAAVVLAFRRDFKEAAGVLAVGVVAVLLATPAGMNLLRGTVSAVFGAQ